MKKILFPGMVLVLLFLSFGAFPLSAADKGAPAIDGNCPVALVEAGALVPGSSQHSVEYQGKTYQFPSEGAKAVFLAHPQKYTEGLETKYEQAKKK